MRSHILHVKFEIYYTSLSQSNCWYFLC